MAGTQVPAGLSALDRLFSPLDRYREYAPLCIRLFVGWHLIYGVQDNILSWERMLEFRDFLTKFDFPVPLVSAVVSVYAQFVCGMLYVIGLLTRPAAALMVFNFIIALLMVHLGDPYPTAALAFAMLSGSLFLLLNGAGKPSVDEWLGSSKK